MWDLGQSHSHCTIVSFVAQQWTPGFQLTRLPQCGPTHVTIAAWWLIPPYAHPQQRMKVSKHLLYAGAGCGTHFMLVWSLNCVICSNPAETLDFSAVSQSQSGSTHVVITAWWLFYMMLIHSIWGLSNTFYLLGLWDRMWEPFHVGLEPQPLQNSCVICSCSPVGTQDFSWLPKSGPTPLRVTTW